MEQDVREKKIVHFNLFRPHRALFKRGKNERAEVQTIVCSSSDNCQLLTRGECMCRAGLFGKRCQYGHTTREQGFSQRARKYYSWCKDQEERHKGIVFLKEPKALGVVGDFVFLPYAHMDMMKSLPWQGSLLSVGDFNVANIIKLVNFRPQAMFGGEITSYQKDIPPLFLKHLSEQMPELFSMVIAADEYSKSRYLEFSNIGREAILETLLPHIGQFKDIHGGLWVWDGETLQSENSHVSFMLVKAFKKITVHPEEKQVVKITHEDQVNKETVFVG